MTIDAAPFPALVLANLEDIDHMDQAADPAAADRQQLARNGQEQLLQMMRSGKQLLDQYSQLQPTSEAQQQLEALQQQYLKAAADIHATLQHCDQLQQQEQAAGAAGEVVCSCD